MGVLMFIEFTGGILLCIYGVEESPTLIEELNEKFLALIYKWDYDPESSRILRQIMEYVRALHLSILIDRDDDNGDVTPLCRSAAAALTAPRTSSTP